MILCHPNLKDPRGVKFVTLSLLLLFEDEKHLKDSGEWFGHGKLKRSSSHVVCHSLFVTAVLICPVPCSALINPWIKVFQYIETKF